MESMTERNLADPKVQQTEHPMVHLTEYLKASTMVEMKVDPKVQQTDEDRVEEA